MAARLRLNGMNDLFELRQSTLAEIERTKDVKNLPAETQRAIALWVSIDKAGEYFRLFTQVNIEVLLDHRSCSQQVISGKSDVRISNAFI